MMRNHITEMKSNRKRLLTYIAISVVLLYFIFAPAINVLYYGGEDFKYASGEYSRTCGGDDGFYFMKTLGRPLQAYMDCVVYKLIYTIRQMTIIRFLSVALLGCGMGLLADLFCVWGFSFWGAFLTAGSLTLIQKLYSDAILTGAISLPFAVLFVILGYRYHTQTHAAQHNRKKGIWLAVICYLCALLTYPAMAFFFGALVLMKLLFSNLADWVKTRREVLQEMMLFCLVSVIYFAWANYNMHFHPQAPVPEQYRMHPSFSITEILSRIKPLTNLFDGGPWVLLFPLGFPLGGALLQGWLTVVLLAGGVLFGVLSFVKSTFYIDHKHLALSYLGQALLSVTVLFAFCSAFYLVIPNRETVGSRLLFATVASGLPLIFWCVYQWSSLWSSIFFGKMKTNVAGIVIGLCFLLQGYQANLIIMYNALNYGQYLYAVKAEIANYLTQDKTLRRIHFIVPEPNYPYNKFFLANAALMQLFGYEHVEVRWCSLPRGVLGEEKDHQNEAMACINSLPKTGIAVTYSRPGEPFKKTDHMLLMQHEQKKIDFLSMIAL